jgi:hypothetical protein
MCARVHVRARVRACACLRVCVPARVSACPRVRVSACPPARVSACPRVRLPAIASMVWFAQNRQQSRGSGLVRWMTADVGSDGLAGRFCAK